MGADDPGRITSPAIRAGSLTADRRSIGEFPRISDHPRRCSIGGPRADTAQSAVAASSDQSCARKGSAWLIAQLTNPQAASMLALPRSGSVGTADHSKSATPWHRKNIKYTKRTHFPLMLNKTEPGTDATSVSDAGIHIPGQPADEKSRTDCARYPTACASGMGRAAARPGARAPRERYSSTAAGMPSS